MTAHQTSTRTKNLRDLRKLLTADEDGLEKFVYSNLRLGDVWWIADTVTKFGERDRHPWVIVRPYSPLRPNVLAAPRTTKYYNKNHKSRGVLTPAGKPSGLDEEGLVLLSIKRTFLAKDFRDFDYIGRLPEDIIKKIRSFLQARRF